MKDTENISVMAANLKRLMSEKKVSMADLSRTLDLPYTTISSWVYGKKYPRIDKIEALANYFGVPKSALIEDVPRYEESDAINRIMAKLYSAMLKDSSLLKTLDVLSEMDYKQRAVVHQIISLISENTTPQT